MAQLALFGNEQFEQSIPLTVAKRWGFDLQYHDIDGTLWYSVQDWISGVSGAKSTQATWVKLKNELFISNEQLKAMPYSASNGKTYQMDFATEKGLYLIAQNLRSTKSRPQLDAVKTYLAESGVFAGIVLTNPDKAIGIIQDANERRYIAQGKSEEWRKERHDARITRKAFTDAVKAHVLNPNYARLTDAEYVGLFERTTKQLNKEMRVTEPRDAMPMQGLALVRIVEYSTMDLLGTREFVSMNEAIDLIKHICQLMQPTIENLQRLLGIDLATGKKLLNA